MSATAWSEPSWIEPAPRSVPASLRVLVVDEREVVGWGFKLLLARREWVDRCLTARVAQDAVALARRHAPHLVLVHLELARCTGLPEEIRAVVPHARLVLTSGAAPIPASEARALGAHDAICTAASARDLVRSVERAAAGLLPWDATDGDQAVPPDAGRAADGPALSRREQEILELMSEGETNREIAARLFLSPYTVKQHTTAVYRKLGVRNRTEAAQRARRLGLIA